MAPAATTPFVAASATPASDTAPAATACVAAAAVLLPPQTKRKQSGTGNARRTASHDKSVRAADLVVRRSEVASISTRKLFRVARSGELVQKVNVNVRNGRAIADIRAEVDAQWPLGKETITVTGSPTADMDLTTA